MPRTYKIFPHILFAACPALVRAHEWSCGGWWRLDEYISMRSTSPKNKNSSICKKKMRIRYGHIIYFMCVTEREKRSYTAQQNTFCRQMMINCKKMSITHQRIFSRIFNASKELCFLPLPLRRAPLLCVCIEYASKHILYI